MASQEEDCESVPRYETFLCWVRMFSPCLLWVLLWGSGFPHHQRHAGQINKGCWYGLSCMGSERPSTWAPESHCASNYSITGQIMTSFIGWIFESKSNVYWWKSPVSPLCFTHWCDQMRAGGSSVCLEVGWEVTGSQFEPQRKTCGHVGPCVELAAHSGVDPAFTHCAPSLWPLKAIKWWR